MAALFTMHTLSLVKKDGIISYLFRHHCRGRNDRMVGISLLLKMNPEVRLNAKTKQKIYLILSLVDLDFITIAWKSW
jgi:hypothetical protein